MNKDELLRPHLPNLRLDVAGSDTSGELLMHDGTKSYPAALRGQLWELFSLLLNAQLATSREDPHGGFRKTERIRATLRDRPLSDEVARRVHRLRDRLAAARFGSEWKSNPSLRVFREQIIERKSLGYRLSIPPANIRFTRVEQ